jgi:hypothetical protein
MLLSKHMLQEALQQYHQFARFFQVSGLSARLQHKVNPLGLLRFDQASVVDLNKDDSCCLNTWEEKDENDTKLYIFGQQPEEEARIRQATYHLIGSPTALQILAIRFAYGVYDYDDLDLSIDDIRSGITFFDQLPKGLQKVTFVIGHSRERSGFPHPEGFLRVREAIKAEARRIANMLVDTPGEQCEEMIVCRYHGIPTTVCPCKIETRLWRFTATCAAYRRAQRLS